MPEQYAEAGGLLRLVEAGFQVGEVGELDGYTMQAVDDILLARGIATQQRMAESQHG